MALIKYSLTLVAKQDAPFNVLPNTDVTIRRVSDNGLVLIYSDADGLIPIAQPGAKTNPRGVFEFYTDSLPVVKAVWSDGGSTYEEVFNGNSLQALSGLTDPSDLDQTHRTEATLARLAAGDYSAGSKLVFEELGGAKFNVVIGGTPNGYDIRDAGGGNTAIIVVDGWMTPEMYGADGTAPKDTNAIKRLVATSLYRRYSAGVTYEIDSDVAGQINTIEDSSSGAVTIAYGAKFNLRGTTAISCFVTTGVSDWSWFGGSFYNPDLIFTNSLDFRGVLSNILIRDVNGYDVGQYHIAVQDFGTSYDGFTVENCKAFRCDSANNNAFSIPFEFYPKLPSKGLRVTNCYAEMIGKGSCFKVHNCTDTIVSGNKFVRSTNVGDSQSQCVMLGGRPLEATSGTKFHDNEIVDQNTAFGALFVGNGSDNTDVHDNKISGNGGYIYIGNSLIDSKIHDNSVVVIASVGATNDIENVDIYDNTVAAINLRDGLSTPPSNITKLRISSNLEITNLRIGCSGVSTGVDIKNNQLSNITTNPTISCDNVKFLDNTVEISDLGNGSSQIFSVTGDDWLQSGNTWLMKGLVSQTVWLNGAGNAQVIGETIDSVNTRTVLDNGVGTQQFDNNLKLTGGSWAKFPIPV